ncbi:serine/threonine protein kinase [Thioclava sp. ES.031]|uniref:serine/threonine-protein kinase n=1 Tax=Thioclava sp. ES.031 TaxID=1798203 RepID=UPI000BF27851|nr:serine/threonine-protein kinase [Thioclava sp. ES.031]PFG63741.1 serine/threonine protein kinase [Thioclava sp. ES.031]
MLKPHNVADVEFRLIREIGHEGRNSTAYIVHDLQLDAEIVMKRIDKVNLNSSDEYFAEARALYSTAHQNVVPVLYACADDDHVFIALPYYENGSLKPVISARNLTVREIVKISCQLISGLHNIHSKNLVHFDIKPDNVLLSGRGEPLLSDFGLAKQMYLGEAWQTRFYTPIVAPEVLTGPPYDLRYDIYQLGLLMYRMCCGEGNFRAQFDAAHSSREAFATALQNGTFPDRNAFPEHIPDRLRRAVVRCLEPDPEDRYDSALAVANDLGKVDQCLDWSYEHNGARKVWSLSKDGSVKRFEVDADGSTVFTTTNRNGRSRRKNAHCQNRMTKTAIRRVLRVEQ